MKSPPSVYGLLVHHNVVASLVFLIIHFLRLKEDNAKVGAVQVRKMADISGKMD